MATTRASETVEVEASSDGPPVRRPVAIDLFAGCGGLSLGFHMAGFDVVAAVEYDPVHAATHLYNFPNCAVICRDARTLSGEEVLRTARGAWEVQHPDHEWGGIDVIIGGPPCQGFSTGGKRDAEDHRNDLILQFVRLVEEIRPRAFCMENVSGFLEAKFSPIRDEAVGRLQTAGYSISGSDRTVDVKDFGVPQSRRRVIMLGSLDGRPTMPQGSASPVTVAQALDGLPSIESYEGLFVTDSIELSPADAEALANPRSPYAQMLATPSLAAPASWRPEVLTGARRTTHTQTTLDRFSKTNPGTVEPKSRLFRLNPSSHARTLRAGSGSERGSHTSPRPIHPTLDRVITVREAARLQSFPDWFRFHTTNWHGHRQVGNSVPPLLSQAAALALLEALGIDPLSPLPLLQGDESLLTLTRTSAAQMFNAPMESIPAARVRKVAESSKLLPEDPG